LVSGSHATTSDTRTKTINVLGTIDSQPAIIIAEKTAFSTESDLLRSFSQKTHLPILSLIEHNDIYHWFLASQASGELPRCAEAKLTLIYPATGVHIRKYSSQSLRMVTETPYGPFLL
jgi:m7GpppX diphosphatase